LGLLPVEGVILARNGGEREELAGRREGGREWGMICSKDPGAEVAAAEAV
jgi:hypothetical protein